MGKHQGNYANLIDQANRKGWSHAEFKSQVQNSRAFQESHPGIHDNNGNLRMSPAEYQAQKKAYNQAAHAIGLHNLDDNQIGELIKKDVSAQELSDRLEAIKRIEEYKPALRQFKQALEARGINADKLNLNNNDNLADFILGLGPKKFYKIWEGATIGTAAFQAGVDTHHAAERWLAKSIPGHMSEVELQAHFKNIAQHIQTTVPLSKIHGFGLSRRDLYVLEFGGKTKKGKTQAQIGETVQRILDTQAKYEGEQRGTQEAHVGGRSQDQY